MGVDQAAAGAGVMGLIALPAVPPIVEGLILLGAGLGITHQVAPGKEAREQSIRDLADAMSNAQNDAKTKASGGTTAATCAAGNCPPWPGDVAGLTNTKTLSAATKKTRTTLLPIMFCALESGWTLHHAYRMRHR
jgi:hypothetical protein